MVGRYFERLLVMQFSFLCNDYIRVGYDLSKCRKLDADDDTSKKY